MDLEPLFLRPSSLRPFTAALAAKLAEFEPDAICGPLVGGALVAQLIALELDVEFLFTERLPLPQGAALLAARYRLPEPLRPAATGRRVAVVDDLISAGSSARATIEELHLHGASVVTIGALLVMGEGANDLTIQTLGRVPYRLWDPAACPNCARGVQLEDVR